VHRGICGRACENLAEACARAEASGDDLTLAHVYEVWGEKESAADAFRRCLSAPALTAHGRLIAEGGLRRLGRLP
jgi:hypothetical protein